MWKGHPSLKARRLSRSWDRRPRDHLQLRLHTDCNASLTDPKLARSRSLKVLGHEPERVSETLSTKIEPATKRTLPRPFAFHWGKGEVIEEASIKCTLDDHSWEPTIQLLRYENGGQTLRFCVFHGKQFARMPLLISPEELTGLINEASKHKRIRSILARSASRLARGKDARD